MINIRQIVHKFHQLVTLISASTLYLRPAVALRCFSSPTPRYPIGYDPDNRSRPQYHPVELLYPSNPKPAKWHPPKGYDPLERRKQMKGNSENEQQVERLRQTLRELHPHASDEAISLYLGIWVGKAVLDTNTPSELI